MLKLSSKKQFHVDNKLVRDGSLFLRMTELGKNAIKSYQINIAAIFFDKLCREHSHLSSRRNFDRSWSNVEMTKIFSVSCFLVVIPLHFEG